MPPRIVGLYAAVLVASFLTASAAPKEQAVSSAQGGVSSQAVNLQQGLRSWTVEDSIGARVFPSEAISVSPNGAMFFFTIFHGDLSCDCNEYELRVFTASDVKKALARRTMPQPFRTLVRRSANHSGSEFLLAKWDEQSSSISFNGIDAQNNRQLYRYDVHSGELVAQTDWPHGVDFQSQEFGETIVAVVTVPDLQPPPSPAYPMHVLGQSEMMRSILRTPRPITAALYGSHKGAVPWKLDSSPEVISGSPDGRRLVALHMPSPSEIPDGWGRYDGINRALTSGHVEDANVRRFIVIDAEHGTATPVFDAPTGDATRVGSEQARRLPPASLWAHDQRHLVLVNTALPLTADPSGEHARMAYIVGYDVLSATWEVIEPLEWQTRSGGPMTRVTEVGWLKKGTVLLIRHETGGRASAGTVYRFSDGKWQGNETGADLAIPQESQPKPATSIQGLTVELRQSANDPPMMIASDGRHEVPLLATDPALHMLRWIRQEPFRWLEPGGQMRTGGLSLPESSGNHAPPLVIQAYSYEPTKFRPDGPATNSYSAQALLAQGFAVLTIDIPLQRDPQIGLRAPQELTEFTSDVDSAADALASKGLIDRTRVGVVGFSRAGFNIYYAVTHPKKTPLAAAVIDDGYQGGYGSMLIEAALGVDNTKSSYGGSFWKNRAVWLEHEITFNADQVLTPLLSAVHSESSIPFILDIVSAFAINQRPLEFLVFPDGKHVLEMPRERLASQQATLDWMRFWLQGKAPADSQQAARWILMKADWDRVRQAAPVSPTKN